MRGLFYCATTGGANPRKSFMRFDSASLSRRRERVAMRMDAGAGSTCHQILPALTSSLIMLTGLVSALTDPPRGGPLHR